MDVLCGRAKVVQDLGSFVLPGSKRLITERGMFGNNLDVLPPDSAARGRGWMGAGGGGGFRKGLSEEIAQTELCLDVAIFEDGLCVRPDESGLFEIVTDDQERQRDKAQEIVAALRNRASVGQVFEALLPLARRPSSSSRGSEEHAGISSPFPQFVREHGYPSARKCFGLGAAGLV